MKPQVAIKLLRIALAKCTLHKGQVWMGYLTAFEQKILVTLGAQVDVLGSYDSGQAYAQIGEVHRTWLYFIPTGKLKELLELKEVNDE